jgi:hypothetical protein
LRYSEGLLLDELTEAFLPIIEVYESSKGVETYEKQGLEAAMDR